MASEEYYSSTNVGPTTAYIQLPPNSAAAAPLGLGSGLQPEKSLNFSAGLVWRPLPHMNATLDLYQITITNRIVGSGNVAGAINGAPQPGEAAINAAIAAYSHGSDVIDPDVLKTGSYGINIFANGIDTRTRGADLVFDFPYDYSFGTIDWTVSGTYNETSITKYATTPPHLKLSVGAVNAFNRFPNKLNSNILSREQNYPGGDNAGVTQYPIFSPFGINGGFYYAKAIYKF